MEYKLIRSKRKSLAIKITDKCEIIVYAPNKCGIDYINSFIQEKSNWINSKMIKQRQNVQKLNKYSNLEEILFLGENKKIYDNNKCYNIGNFNIKYIKTSKKGNIIKNFLLEQAKLYLIERTIKLAEQLNLSFGSIKIISSKHKWGSCSNKKEIRLNYKLIMLPKEYVDYVIYHELCHLIEFNHSTKFWNLLKKIGYKKTEIKQKFNDYKFVLHLF